MCANAQHGLANIVTIIGRAERISTDQTERAWFDDASGCLHAAEQFDYFGFPEVSAATVFSQG